MNIRDLIRNKEEQDEFGQVKKKEKLNHSLSLLDDGHLINTWEKNEKVQWQVGLISKI